LTPDVWIYLAIVAIAILIYFSARFSGAETSITAIDAVEVAELVSEGKKNARFLVKIKDDLDRTIVAILIGNNLVNITISALATLVANELMGNLGVSIAVGLLTLFILIFGEITPKAYAIDNKVRRSLINARWLYYMTRALSPLISVLIWMSKGVLRMVGATESETQYLLVSDKQVRQLASLGVEQGAIEDVEHDIIERALDFGEVHVSEIMMDREHVFAIPSGTPLEEAEHMIAERPFTRIPVIKSTEANGNGDAELTHAEEVVGVVYVKDLFGMEGGIIDDYVRPPFYVFPDVDAADVFNEMRKNRIHMGLVADEGGNLLGIVTLEDLIEEVMGEIHDESQDMQFPDGEPD
jgi:CBS domain containing-hemolysin-like protein